MTNVKESTLSDAEIHSLHKEWEEVSCPICMDHPHNAVLLICSSHDKGCRSYICDTSYRHSNCLDRFKKLAREGKSSANPTNYMQSHNKRRLDHTHDFSESNLNVKCPLCRGPVSGWKIVEEARQCLDKKERSCSRESCSFSGNYRELRRHARCLHPRTRPADVNPSRQRAWHHLEHQQEYRDIVSAIHSAIPGSVVLGDYVIDNGDELSSEGNGSWLTTYFLFHMFSPLASFQERRSIAQAWRRYRRSPVSRSSRRNSWGENLLGSQEQENDWNLPSDTSDEDVQIPRRRRLNRNDEAQA